MKRAKKPTKCANPLFEQWLEEWRQEALAKDSPIAYSFRKALTSLRKYPLPLARGRDCQILQNFGQKLCTMLDKKLEQYKKLNDLPSSGSTLPEDLDDDNDGVQEKRPKTTEKKKKKSDDDSSMEKDVDSVPQKEKAVKKAVVVISDVSEDEQEVFDDRKAMKPKDARVTNLARTQSTESSSSTEAYNRFCEENAEPTISVQKKPEHFLFREPAESLPRLNSNSEKVNGRVIGILEEVQNQNKNPDEAKKGKGKGKGAKKKGAPADDEPYDIFYLLPNNFDVVLLVDTQETSGGKTKPQDDQTIAALSESGILFEIRSLKIGDFAWVARCRFTNKELVLPYIVERKRIDDLSASIIDGRYKEQKFRLKQSGIKNVIYMVENYGKNYYGSIPLSSLLQASVNSLIQDDFIVKYTYDHKDSMRYLATMTSMITKIYESKELTSCRKKDMDTKDFNVVKCTNVLLMEFTEFNKAAKKTKNFRVREMFMRQLLQLKGISVDKAIAIASLYPTPKALADAFKEGDESLLAKIPFGTSNTKIGPAISKTLHQFYTRYNFN